MKIAFLACLLPLMALAEENELARCHSGDGRVLVLIKNEGLMGKIIDRSHQDSYRLKVVKKLLLTITPHNRRLEQILPHRKPMTVSWSQTEQKDQGSYSILALGSSQEDQDLWIQLEEARGKEKTLAKVLSLDGRNSADFDRIRWLGTDVQLQDYPDVFTCKGEVKFDQF